MSCQEVKLIGSGLVDIKINEQQGYLVLTTNNRRNAESQTVIIDRGQAHLLKLFLEEYLK